MRVEFRTRYSLSVYFVRTVESVCVCVHIRLSNVEWKT